MVYKIIEILTSAFFLFIFYELLTDGFNGIQGKIKKCFMNITGYFFGGLGFHIIKDLQRRCNKLCKKAETLSDTCLYIKDEVTDQIKNCKEEIRNYYTKLDEYPLFRNYDNKELYNIIFEYTLFQSQMEIKIELLNNIILNDNLEIEKENKGK